MDMKIEGRFGQTTAFPLYNLKMKQNKTVGPPCEGVINAIKGICNAAIFGGMLGGSQAILSLFINTGSKILFSSISEKENEGLLISTAKISMIICGIAIIQNVFSNIMKSKPLGSNGKIIGSSLAILGVSAWLTGTIPTVFGGLLGMMNTAVINTLSLPAIATSGLWYTIPGNTKETILFTMICGVAGFFVHASGDFCKRFLVNHEVKIIPQAAAVVTSGVAIGAMQAGLPGMQAIAMTLNSSFLYILWGALGALIGRGIEGAINFLNL